MKMFLIAVVGAACMFPSELQAQIFKRRASRVQARQQTNYVTPYAGQQQYCAQDGCTVPGGGGPLRINGKGGFEGQLPDQEFANYFNSKTGGSVQQSAPVQQFSPVQQPVPTPIPVPTTEVSQEAAVSVQSAMSALQAAKKAVESAEELLQVAMTAQKQEAEEEAIKVEANIKLMELKHQREIEGLKERQSVITRKVGDPTLVE